MFQRFLGNVGMRYAYTFLPELARSSDLSLKSLGRILAVRDLTAVISPAIGRLSDRFGTTRIIVYGSVTSAVGLLLATLGPVGLAIGFAIFGAGKIATDVSTNSWVADEVAFERRGRVTGVVELTWAAAALIGLPLSGLMISRLGWWSVTLFLGLASIPTTMAIQRTATPGRPTQRERVRPEFTTTVIGALIMVFAVMASSQLLLVGHGLWLEDQFGLETAEIGFAVTVVGAIEMVASLGSASLTDTLGKRISVATGSGLLFAASGALAVYREPSLIVGLLLLAAAFLGFEFAFVSSLPLISELAPRARAEMIGIALGAGTVVRAAGTEFGTTLYGRSGFSGLMVVSAVTAALAVLLAVFVVREPGTDVEAAAATSVREPGSIPE